MADLLKRQVMITRKTIVEDGIYHVTQRAPGREIVFVEDGDYLYFLGLLKQTSLKFETTIFCFALLPNHLHILLKIKQRNLDKAMKYLFQRYAQWFNRKYERKGHVFCGAYRASFCSDERYLLTASLYIHLNPFKAGLTRNSLHYRWSSINIYINQVEESFVNPDEILIILGDKQKARLIYRGLVKEAESIKLKNIIDVKTAARDFFVDFIRLLRKRIKHSLFKDSLSLRTLLRDKIWTGTVKMKKRKTGFNDKKAFVYYIQQLQAKGFSYTEIANYLNVDRTTIYRVLNSNATKMFTTEMLR